jgi:DNA (cytosine-5)-methyltransferase 1
MKVLDLFSGIGGFSLGLERAGMETVAFCEIEEYPRQVLKKHWPDVPIYEDVRNVTRQRLESDGITGIDVVTGGFPCQDISVAGKQAGIEGERSGLWSELARIIGDIRPKYAIVENVTALLSGDRGQWFGRVLGDLAEIGYDAEWHCIPASELGAHHHRDRVWIICYSNSERFTEPGNVSEQQGRAKIKWTSETISDRSNTGYPKTKNGGENVADTVRERGFCWHSRWEDAKNAWQSSFDSWHHHEEMGIWDAEPDVGRVANGLSAELDFLGRIDEQINGKKTKPEIDLARWRFLRAVWENRELAKTSRRLYFKRLQDFVPDLPYELAQTRWLLGSRLEETKGLRDLWKEFYSKSFEEAQDVQQRLLERIRTTKRPTALGSRIDRLKGLGNAVVPQIPELIGRAIMEAEHENKLSTGL